MGGLQVIKEMNFEASKTIERNEEQKTKSEHLISVVKQLRDRVRSIDKEEDYPVKRLS